MGRSALALAAALRLLLDQFRYQPSPTCLMARTQPCSIIPVQVFIEQDMVAPVRIALEFLLSPKDRATTVCTAQKE